MRCWKLILIDENEQMQTRIMQLEAMLAAAQDEIEERDQAIIELYQKYEEVIKENESDGESEVQSVSDDNPPVDRVRNKRKKAQKVKREKIIAEDHGDQEPEEGQKD